VFQYNHAPCADLHPEVLESERNRLRRCPMAIVALTWATEKSRQRGSQDHAFQEHFMAELVPSRFPFSPLWLQASPPGEHTTLLLVMAVAGVIGVAALVLLYARKRSLQSDVEARFKLFRERAVGLMEQLDALRKRHTTLPATDPDFTVPMTGATRTLYDQVNRDLDGLWERWLKVMEIWDQAQQRVRAGSGLMVKPTEEARTLLEGSEIDDLVRQSTSCKERLDRLNDGHERAREALATTRAQLASVQHDVTKGTGVLLPSDTHHREIESAERALADAEAMLTADPLGALTRIEEARAAIDSISERPRTSETWHRDGRTSSSFIDELIAEIERLRAAVARLRVSDLVVLLVKAWVAIWIVSLLFGVLLPFLIPIIILAVPLIFLVAGLAVLRVVLSMLGLGRGGRR
jgi:hypothetical protein